MKDEIQREKEEKEREDQERKEAWHKFMDKLEEVKQQEIEQELK